MMRRGRPLAAWGFLCLPLFIVILPTPIYSHSLSHLVNARDAWLTAIHPCGYTQIARVHAEVAVYDVVVKNARIVDGSGMPSTIGDVAVAGDKIAAVGRIKDSARRTLDAD